MNLIAAAIIGIAIIVLLIAVCKVHPFLSLLAGSFTMAVCAGVEYDKAFGSFTSGVGSTIANVGLLIAFGSIIGTILFKSGGADTIVDTIMAKTPLQRLPWAMALIAFIVGIPMFFEVAWSFLFRWCSSQPAAPKLRLYCWAFRPSQAFPPCTRSCRRTPARSPQSAH